MEHLKYMKSKLVECIEKQMNGNLEYTNAQELGEAVDMVKDLSEAIYYCTITEAMENKSQYRQGPHAPSTHYYGDDMMTRSYPAEHYPPMYNSYDYPVMYASNGMSGGNGGSSRYYDDASTRYMTYKYDYPMAPAGGDRSSMSRKRYMDGKMFNDKNLQMKELEQYTQELASDLTEMIKDASPEEKQLLQQKINMLASKIK
jgi:hypothetical protein